MNSQKKAVSVERFLRECDDLWRYFYFRAVSPVPTFLAYQQFIYCCVQLPRQLRQRQSKRPHKRKDPTGKPVGSDSVRHPKVATLLQQRLSPRKATMTSF
jgi:hypothetical protein